MGWLPPAERQARLQARAACSRACAPGRRRRRPSAPALPAPTAATRRLRLLHTHPPTPGPSLCSCSAFISYVVNQTALDKEYPGAPVVCLTNSGGIR